MNKSTNEIQNMERQWNDASLLIVAVNKLSFLSWWLLEMIPTEKECSMNNIKMDRAQKHALWKEVNN